MDEAFQLETLPYIDGSPWALAFVSRHPCLPSCQRVCAWGGSAELRRVPPYFFTFNCYAKGRWLKRTIYDVFANEFQAETPEYYVRRAGAARV